MNQQRSPQPNFQNSLENFSARDNYRNRQLLLNKVKNYWLKGVLEKSVQGKALIELGLEERLDAIESPWGVAWETPEGPRQILPSGTRVIDKFDGLGKGRSLLILGEPGSGKTTTLLHLAQDLIDRVQQNINHPIPVVFNLSSWKGGKQTISDWLVTELHTQYQIPKPIGQAWIKEQQLLLMLDGLDEVSEKHRGLCVQALNQFGREHGRTEIVVCSRLKDYEILPERLRLQRAIYLQPLTKEQVQRYLAEAGLEMAAVSNLLREDTALQELVTTPLMLNIIILAYQGMSVEDLPRINSRAERRKHIFNAYIQRMFARRRSNQPYSPEQSLHWLTELAFRMSEQSQTIFFIEGIQPNWLQINLQDEFKFPFQRSRTQKTKAYKLYTRGVQLINGLISGGIFALVFALIGNASNGLVGWLVGGLIGAAITKIEPIEPVERLKWSWGNAKQWLPFGLLFGLSGLLTAGFSWGLVLVLSGVLISGLIGSEVETTTVPNQGIWQSAKNAIIFALIGGVLCLTGGAGLAGLLKLPYMLSMSIFTGGILGLILGMLKGGKACIQHFVLRFVLHSNGYIPWNYTRFLNYAAEHTLLQKVGGGYIFRHRLLKEHFLTLGMENYNQSLESNPQNAQAYFKGGNVRARIGDYQGAIADYTQAIEINPDLAEAYAGRSLARYMLGDDGGVLEDYHQTFQLNPKLAQEISYTAKDSTDSNLQAKGEIVKDDNRSYLVTLLNDNVNTFDRVYKCLMKYIPDMTSDRAWQLTLKVHSEGQAVIWSGSEKLAELYRTQLSHAGLSMDVCWPEVDSIMGIHSDLI
ncbi:MAG: ATP-dependent Clp protease adaptor ClpS [Xenococcaceae cyanobacterium]